MHGEAATGDLLKMGQLAQRAGVSPATVRHYLREGLLGGGEDVVKTSRNMAWYPAELVDRIRLIKRLQEERFMPLPVIRQMLEEDPDRLRAMLELEDRIFEHARATRERERVSRDVVHRRYDLPGVVVERLGQLGFLRPGTRGYDADEVRLLEAIARLRAGGYADVLRFTVRDFEMYREALAPLAHTIVRDLVERLDASGDPERALDMLGGGLGPLRDLVGAMLGKLVLDELERAGGSRGGGA